jgi:5-oxoprolinase (ATP-hydrolysing)
LDTQHRAATGGGEKVSGGWQIAVDTGGTFTDCYGRQPDGVVRRCKILSTGGLRLRLAQASQVGAGLKVDGLPVMAQGFFEGWRVRRVGDAGEALVAGSDAGELAFADANMAAWREGDLLELLTGEEAPVVGVRLMTATRVGEAFPPLQMRLATTRATNALLEGKGSATALFVTEGFADLLVIGDQRRRDLFALRHEARKPFTAAVVSVGARVSPEGEVMKEVNESVVRESARALVREGIVHGAVALLHGDLFPEQELQVARCLRAEGFTHVSVSGEIAPFPKLLSRAQSTVANALLTGPVERFVRGVIDPLEGVGFAGLQIMTSAGGLEPAARVKPKDLLLSGPAGGAMGAAAAARCLGFDKVLTLDMGGTSSDVARIEGRPGYRFVQKVAGMELLAPSVAIETVAAGGGSICEWVGTGLRVGPESAGANPGPACYGRGGPLTVTDVNLLLGRFDPGRAPVPLMPEAAQARLRELRERMEADTGRVMGERALLEGLLDLAIEQMADAIRRISVAEGYDPADYALLAFGGAGPQHACAVAERLGMKTVLAPHHAGILSAVGLAAARPERMTERAIHRVVGVVAPELRGWVDELAEEARRRLREDGSADMGFEEPKVIVEMRLAGQDVPLQVEVSDGMDGLAEAYAERYKKLFGYLPPTNREMEVVSLRVSVRAAVAEPAELAVVAGVMSKPVAEMRLIQDEFSTLVVLPGWSVEDREGVGRILRREVLPGTSGERADRAVLRWELLRHRLSSVVEEMGALLCRTAISTNIRERLDFSCAVLDAEGRLVSSAPHIPVHLGALGLCVRECVRELPPGRGDTLITNHPAFGGSHLPDVTLITPVHADDGMLVGYVANRAHHAEIGGLTPGSMPAVATYLAEEGVVIPPRHLVRGGESCFDVVEQLFEQAEHPTRNLADNLADLHAQLAANQLGVVRMRALVGGDADSYRRMVGDVLDHSAQVMRRGLERLPARSEAKERLDDGNEIVAVVTRKDGRLEMDFTGTAPVHPGNLNATPAILRSAVLYVLRVWLQEDLPLNEGLLEAVDVVCPTCLLNPAFSGVNERDPAVVGGNVEVSQRLVDTLFKALGVQACSQGTMNNFLFGNRRFGYYETIGGGAGAGPGYAGASALHTHMTNTAITDGEILERRYPVRLRRFEVRRGSGGAGVWRGGDGVVREFEFLEGLTISLLTQHRVEGPYGMNGGGAGAPGRQVLVRDGLEQVLPASASLEVRPGDRLVIETPGGGGWGTY